VVDGTVDAKAVGAAGTVVMLELLLYVEFAVERLARTR
jgi:hypothetical protein